MSTELPSMKNTGSRGIELFVTRYCGKDGLCLQLTGEMEEGGWGYVQLNKSDILRLMKIWRKNVDTFGAKKS